MARSTFGGTTADYLFSVTSGAVRTRAATLTFWTAEAGGSQITDLLLGGQAVTSIRTGSYGRVPAFLGPDGVVEMWAQADGGERYLLAAPGRPGADGQDGAPGLPGVNAVPADQAVATYASTPGTATNVALSEVTEAFVQEAIVGLEPSTGLLLYENADGFFEIVAPVQPPPALPGVPTGVTVAPGRSQGAVTWSTPTAPAEAPVTSYRLRYRTAGASPGSYTVIDTPDAATAKTVTGLLNATPYTIEVAATNVSGTSAYSAPVTFTPGTVNGVVASDTFARSAAELVGTSPTVGLSPYSGATGQWATNGTRAVAASAPSGGLTLLDVGARGDTTLSETAAISSVGEAATRNRRFYAAYVNATNGLYLQVSVATSGSVTATVSVVAAGDTTAVITSGAFPGNVIPASTALADYPIALGYTITRDSGGTITGGTVSTTVGSATRTGTLTAAQAAAIASSTKVGWTATSTSSQMDDMSVAVNGTYV